MKKYVKSLIDLVYKRDHPFMFNFKRISISAIIVISFIISAGRIYCFYDDAFVLYGKYRNLSNKEIRSALNYHVEFALRIKEKVAPGESILAVTHDPGNFFLSYYLYPRKVYKYKNVYFRASPETLEEVPKEWLLEHDIKWIMWGHDEPKIERPKN